MKSPTTILFLILFTQILTAKLLGVSSEEEYEFAIELKETFDKEKAIKDENELKFDDSIRAKQIMDQMGFGWNLGNTLDAWHTDKQDQGLDSETVWGVTKTTEDIIKGLVDKGIKTIRIPVTWHNHIIDDKYTIDPEWMQRVKTIVDWSIRSGLYVILNTHHDNAEHQNIKYGQGYYPLRQDIVESEKFIYNIFRQIATAFNNGYDHHLIFEGLNEPRLVGTSFEWNYQKGEYICEEANSVLNEYLKLIVKAIRTTGGNNEKRFILVTPLAAAYSSAINQDFVFPGDSAYNPTNPKILLSVHMYLPYNFVMNPDMSFTTFEESYANELYSDFKNLYETFVLKGINIIVGEMGIVNKNNTEERVKWAKYYVSTARKFNMPCILWDNEYFDNTKSVGDTFGLYKRGEGKWEPEELIDAFVDAAKTTMEEDPVDENKDNLISAPYEFEDWKQNFDVGVGVFSAYNSYCKLVIKTTEPSYSPQYRMFNIYLGDWSSPVITTQEEVTGGTTNGEGGISLTKGEHTIEVKFSKNNLDLVKQRGIYLLGHGFSLTKIAIEGPKLISISPKKIIRTKTEVQKVTLTFSETATDLVGNIKLINKFYNINRKLACIADSINKNIIHCEGLYDFTGEYQLWDDKGNLLSSRTINVIPNEGEKYDIDNLLSEKVLFDVISCNKGVKLPSKLFTKVDSSSTLVLETTELFFKTSRKVLFVLRGDGDIVIKFDSSKINAEIKEDGGIIVPEGNNLIKIILDKNSEIIMEKGIKIIGYGFGLKTVFLE